ncbi:hypothetical protein LSP04_15900 [Levilactobacillus spicheri]|uniref:Uncharacterized protein n=1 Tax=Levilactobacillus spicheri TaxID=216463 RepID=A0ABQ0WQ35_9LACO|nr:hypothetical protein LSP04_15900 [Levilactobacillus spicheri]
MFRKGVLNRSDLDKGGARQHNKELIVPVVRNVFMTPTSVSEILTGLKKFDGIV